MKPNKGFITVLMMVLISISLSTFSRAAFDTFSDVPNDSPFHESIFYLAERGIVCGEGNGRYVPDAPVTVRQWATMLCRALGDADPLNYDDDCIRQGYSDGWLEMTAITAPDSDLCRYAIYKSGFAAFGVDLYSLQLYPNEGKLSQQSEVLRAAADFGLCEDTCDGTEIITRGEAAELLYALLTKTFAVVPPPIQGKNHLDSSKADVERNLKEIVINGTESLDGSSIQGEWFPEINADIFISHSRDDADLANGIAGWINSNFNLHCFIDSNVWGYSDELLEKLNSRYSNKRPNSNGGYLYDHQSCINASKHVDTMLTIALHKMINRCECVILLNTGNAISRMKKYEDLQRDTTFSPWIYSELICSSLIQQRRPERHSSQGMQGTQNFDAVNESLQIAYEVPTKHLLPLDPKTLSAWKAAYVGNKLHPLDVLYNQFPQIQKNILNG